MHGRSSSSKRDNLHLSKYKLPKRQRPWKGNPRRNHLGFLALLMKAAVQRTDATTTNIPTPTAADTPATTTSIAHCTAAQTLIFFDSLSIGVRSRAGRTRERNKKDFKSSSARSPLWLRRTRRWDEYSSF